MMFGLIGMLVCDTGGGFSEPPRPDTGFFFDDTGFFDSGDDCTPWIDVEPDTLSFAYNDDDSSSFTRELTIYNGGTCELVIDGYEVIGDQVFSVQSLGGQIIDRGDLAVATVTFSPPELGEYAAVIEIMSNDPYLPVVSVDLTGTWEPLVETGIPRLEPESLSFADVAVGCGLTDTLSLNNDGHVPLSVTGLTLESATEELVLLTEGPLELAPGAVRELEVGYAPLDRFEDSGVLRIETDGDPAELTASVSGTSVMGQEQELLVEGDGVTRSFELPVAEVVVALLAVGVDGVEQTEGWSYDSESNAVVFEEASTPPEGSMVAVSYLPQPACD